MKCQALVVVLCLLPVLCAAQNQTTTITPIPLPSPGQNSSPPQQAEPSPSKLVIERPVPETSIVPKPVPHADSEADQAIRKQADTALAEQAANVADDCDASFGARIDWTTISAEDIHLAMPENTCGAVLDALDEYCKTSEGRTRVAKAIKGIICTAGQGPALALHAGTLLYTLDWQSANPGSFAYAWLAGHL
jgi:hypothetical protein